MAQLRAFILTNGSARFDVWADPVPPSDAAQAPAESAPPVERFRTMKRAGWRKWEQALETGGPGWRYFLTAEGKNEALAGLAPRDALRKMVDLGHIVPPDSGTDAERGNLSKLYNVPGHPKVRLYQVGSALLSSTEDSD